MSRLYRYCLLLLSSCYLSHANAPPVSEAPLRAHLAFLADELLQGRGTGQVGGQLTVRYLETQLAALGLEPLKPGQFRQAVQITGIKTDPTSQIKVHSGEQTIQWQFGNDVVLATAQPQAHLQLSAEMVFVGYGISAKEMQWDDYKGVDVRGKLVLMLLNQPPPTSAEPALFGGNSLSYYGRWDYKFEEAKRRGAAGVLVLHTDASASYPWRVPVAGFQSERFHLGNSGNQLEGWLQDDAAQQLFRHAGLNLAALRQQAQSRQFKPVPLPARLELDLRSSVRQFTEYNVVAKVAGSDPALQHEAVIYSAHWDHLGVQRDATGQSVTYLGAIDNASGAAALLAMAQAAVQNPTRRSQIFFWPCAEEEGLLGSLAFMRSPWWPLNKIVANLNLDTMNFVGKTADMAVPGVEYTDLRPLAAEVAQQQGLVLLPTQPDPAGAYFRSDNFSFARYGIPAFRVGSSVFSSDGKFTFIKHQVRSLSKIKAFAEHYHQPSDRYDASWDLTGMTQQAQYTLALGMAIANRQQRPQMAPASLSGGWQP